MSVRQSKCRTFTIILASIVFTLLIANRTGKSLELFWVRVYQEIIGKKPQHFRYDSKGIPVVVYEGKLGEQYNTVAVAEYAIRLSEKTEASNESYFFNCINWLIYNGTVLNDSSIIFLNRYDWSGYKMISPWRSAMNQGRAMQAFIKAYEKTGDTIYLNYARRSMNSLYVSVKEGGVTYMDSTGYWYEEYADDDTPQSRVLNGMIAVLQGLSDFYKVTSDPGSLFLFRAGISSVKRTLHQYDDDGHSNYDVLGKPANPWYHKFHIEQLGFLYSETNDPVFNEYKLKWMKYMEPAYLAALIKKPTNIGLFTVFTIFISVLSILLLFSYLLLIRK